MPSYLKSWPHGLRKFRQLLIIAVPIFLLGLFQTSQPVDSVWNQYADPNAQVATFGTADAPARVTGTFAYITEFSHFAEICALVTVFLMLAARTKLTGRLWNTGILILALGTIMGTGSRGPAVVFAAQVLGVAALSYTGVRAIPMRHLLPFVAFILFAASASVVVLDRQATEFFSRAEDIGTSDIDSRVDAAFFEWLDVIYQYPLGVGLGAGHQAFSAEMWAIGIPNLWEVELSRLAFELGLGVLFYIAFKVTLIGQLLTRMKSMRTRAGRVTLATCTVTLIPLLVTGSVYETLTNAAFWAFVGVGFWVVKLEAASLLARPVAAPEFARADPAPRPGNLVGESAP